MAVQAQLYQENLGFPLSCGSQDWASEINGCGSGSNMNQLCFNAQPKYQNLYHHQQQQQLALLQELQSLNQRNDIVLSNTIPTAMFEHLEKKERREIDQYIKSQNERLRSILQEQRKQEIATLMSKAEPKLAELLRAKEAEISRERKRTKQLEDLLRKIEEESEAWQRVARENEAIAVSLTAALEQARRHSAAEDAESCCGGDGGDGSERGCRNCGRRKATVLFLPCRHFCSCKDCEGFLDCCPVCAQPKKACIEALTH